MGIRDSIELALEDWLRYGDLEEEEGFGRRWAECFIARCLPDVRDFVERFGVRFFFGVNWTERGWFVPGNSVPRFHVVWGAGEGLVDPLIAALRNQEGVSLRFRHRVTGFLEEAGRIAGCHGTGPDGAFEVRADATVLASGGIAGNLDKVRSVWPSYLGEPPEILLNGSIPEADGALIDAAADVGAVVTDLSRMWNYAAGVRHFRPRHEGHGLSLVPMKSPLWVNYQGRRFVDPPLVGSFDTLALIERICREKKKYSWQILNHRIMRREFAVSGAEFNRPVRDKRLLLFLWRLLFGNAPLAREFVTECRDLVTAESVGGLAAKMNELTETDDVDADLLAREVRLYDAAVLRPRKLHNDDQLRRIAHARQYLGDRMRTCRFAPIDDTSARPLIAIRLQILTRKSLGGLAADLQGRVVGSDLQPIPGLYAAGESCGFGGGGMHGKRALEGTFLGGCIFTGRVVARALAKGKGADEI